MAKRRSPWQDGRRAWERLHDWLQDKAATEPAHPDDGDQALDALADVGLVRRLLDQAELVAVRTARGHSKSWAEIAIRLGVTRQSAWERWRELDDSATTEPTEAASPRDQVVDVAAAAVTEEQAAHARRRRSSVRVPNVVGESWDDARRALDEAGLVAVSPDPDGPPLATLAWPDGIVTDQSPESGAKVPPGAPVTLWFERSGGTGVREPRRPKPNLGTGYAMRDEQSDEAVS
jgi:PASTA domain